MDDTAQERINRLTDSITRLATAVECLAVPFEQNAVIDRVLTRGWSNLREASIYVGRSDTYLRRHLHDPGEGPPDPTRLNGTRGRKDWTFTVRELDRFNQQVLRAMVPTADADGVEIRKAT